MSYDLDMFALQPGTDVDVFFETRESDTEIFNVVERCWKELKLIRIYTKR